MSWAEAKWIQDKLLQATGRAPANMRMFTTEIISKTSVGLKFLEPADTYVGDNLMCATGGVMIRMSDVDYPSNMREGVLVVDNREIGKYENNAFVVDNLVEGKTYYFSAFPYSTQGVYKVSDTVANRAVCTPRDGEIANVIISVDDASGFKSVTVTCVDETDSSLTQTAYLTASTRAASFAIPNGHRYHIEYGDADAYTTPSDTASKTAVAGTVSTYEATYIYFTVTINVTYPKGAVLTCTYGNTSYTASDTSGEYQFKVHAVGTWIVTAALGGETRSEQVVVTTDGQVVNLEIAFAKIYGISRDISQSSPVWARTDSAVDMTATASVGTNAGNSDFDNHMPWKGIVRETLSTGDVMVKIPKFYYRRYKDGNIEYIKVADEKVQGFKLHPAFNRNGVEKDYIYVGAYKSRSHITAGVSSVSGAAVYTDTSKNARTNIAKKGAGWSLVDISTVSAIQMLILVEFATNDTQSVIGAGITGAGAKSQTGLGDTIPNLTGRTGDEDQLAEVAWRGIEGFWGNVDEWVDGVYSNAGTYYVCNDRSKYAEPSDATGYTALGYPAMTAIISSYIIKEMGVDEGDNDHIMLPIEKGGSDSTYYCDYLDATSSAAACFRGGKWSSSKGAGLFRTGFSTSGSHAVRLLYIAE